MLYQCCAFSWGVWPFNSNHVQAVDTKVYTLDNNVFQILWFYIYNTESTFQTPKRDIFLLIFYIVFSHSGNMLSWNSCLLSGCFSSCLKDWQPNIGNTCMRVFFGNETWSGAQAACRAKGAELLTVETRNGQRFVSGWLRAKCNWNFI